MGFQLGDLVDVRVGSWSGNRQLLAPYRGRIIAFAPGGQHAVIKAEEGFSSKRYPIANIRLVHEPLNILHLFADTGSDTWPYRDDPRYNVITVGADIGVENYTPDRPIHGIVANVVCTELSPAKHGQAFGGGDRPERNIESARDHIAHTMRIIEAANPKWWAIENPAGGLMRQLLGKPDFAYEPWQFGSPWTKRTGLWGKFTAPTPVYDRFEDVPLNPDLYVRPGRRPSMAWLHKSAWDLIPEFRDSGMPRPESDMELRSLCSQHFARAFKKANP